MQVKEIVYFGFFCGWFSNSENGNEHSRHGGYIWNVKQINFYFPAIISGLDLNFQPILHRK